MRCDCHVHVIGPGDNYPQVSNRTYLAMPAPLTELQRLGTARGMSRFVVVQPSFYGTDNSVLLQTLTALGDHGRGVAVIDAQISQATLADFARCGVRGLRINLYSPLVETGSLSDNFSALAGIAQKMNWHVEVIAPLAMLAAASEVLGNARTTVVLDHYGVHGALRPHSAEGRRLIALLRAPHVWMKLSAPYRSSDDPLRIAPDGEWLAAILTVAKERCVWGSDWPHTPAHEAHRGSHQPAPHRKLDYRDVVDAFVTAIGDSKLAEEILSENPRRLYGF